MRLLKKTIFWAHLVAGLAAGTVILILGITGVIMSFERQILEANHGVIVKKPSGELLVAGPEKILTNHADRTPSASGLTYYNDPDMPVSVQFGRGKSSYADPYTGESLGEGNTALKGFFAWALRLHRWLTMEGASREIGGHITKAANLVFLFLVISGLYLWFPKRWNRTAIRAVTKLQFRLKGRARDWNWHNVFGFWACIPLLIAVLTGVVMSYSWANNLVYHVVGETPPPPRQKGGPAGSAREGRNENRGSRAEGVASLGEGAEGRPRGRDRMASDGGRGGERRGQEPGHQSSPVSLVGLDAGFEAVKKLSPEWRTIIVSQPKGKTAEYAVSTSHRGRPDLRRTITIDLVSGEIVKNEGFESQSTGRKARTFIRWVHTGEALGWVGQALMGLASLAAVILVWTGFALSFRRFFKKRKASITKTKAASETADA